MKIEVMEISEEEKQMLMKHRAEQARKAEIDECMREIQKNVKRIEELKGKVLLPAIGGKYISYHNPQVKSDELCYCY